MYKKKRKLCFAYCLPIVFFLDVLLAVVSSNLLKRNCRHHLILQRVFVEIKCWKCYSFCDREWA